MASNASTLLHIPLAWYRKMRDANPIFYDTAFTQRSIAQLTPRITKITNTLHDRVIPYCEMDVIEDLAYPLPITIIAELLGVPPAEQNTFKKWSTALVTSPRHTTRMGENQAHIAQTLRS